MQVGHRVVYNLSKQKVTLEKPVFPNVYIQRVPNGQPVIWDQIEFQKMKEWSFLSTLCLPLSWVKAKKPRKTFTNTSIDLSRPGQNLFFLYTTETHGKNITQISQSIAEFGSIFCQLPIYCKAICAIAKRIFDYFKGQQHEIFNLWFFLYFCSTWSPDSHPKIFLSSVTFSSSYRPLK